MGIIRLLLAVAVVITHSAPLFGLRLVPGDVAVEAFFMISGFLMALVLNNKYVGGNGSYWLFISQRLIRLFPVYWIVLLLTIAISILSYTTVGNPFKLEAYLHYSLGIEEAAALAWTNLFIIGQDIIHFLGLAKDGSFFYTSNFSQTSPQVWSFLFVHQAWSLSIELMFYLLAPFLVRQRVVVLVLLSVVSMGIRLWLYQNGLYQDPWSYRFFPSELLFFLLGALGYHGYTQLKSLVLPTLLLRGSLIAIVAFTILYQFIPDTLLRQVVYYVCFAVALPFIFIYTRQLTGRARTWDNKIGELSYPVYISHILVLSMCTFLLRTLHLDSSYLPAFAVILTILFSLLLVRFVVEPVERVRQRRATKQEALVVA